MPPPQGHAVPLALAGVYSPPPGHRVALALGAAPAEPCYVIPPGHAVPLALAGAYTPPPGHRVALALVCAGGPPPPEPEPPYLGVGIAARARLLWGAGSARALAAGMPVNAPPVIDHQRALAWQWGIEHARTLTFSAHGLIAADAAPALAWQWATDHARTLTFAARERPAVDRARSMRWRWADDHQVSAITPWGNPPPKDGARALPWGFARASQIRAGLRWDNPPAKDGRRRLPWDFATPLRQAFGERPLPPLPPAPDKPPCYTPPQGAAVPLALAGAYVPPSGEAVPLALVCRAAREYKIKRTLIMQHTLTACVLPSRAPIDLIGVSVSTDRDSWGWTLQAQLATRASYHAVMPDSAGPKLIEVQISGHTFTALVEDAREQRGGPGRLSTFTISGRSRTAQLAEPYATARAYVSAEPMTAGQAVARELDATGFVFDWLIDDWTIPAGAWRYDFDTPMGAILRVARAAGAVVQSHPADAKITIQPAYPAAPWQWGSAPADVMIEGQSLIEAGRQWQPGAQYLGVYVSGETDGVLVGVIRDGSAGQPYAQMIVDPLITSTAPARARGLRVIADAENQTLEPIVMPLQPAGQGIGIVHPTELVQVTDPNHGVYRAQARSVSISAGLDSSGAVVVRQTVDLARHYSQDLG